MVAEMSEALQIINFLTQGRLALKALHQNRQACRLQADKGYGPCLVPHRVVKDLYSTLQSSSSFAMISHLQYGALLLNAQTTLFQLLDRALALRWILQRTFDWIVTPFREIATDINGYAGTIRFMPKINKIANL